jgi:serine/threonine protein kinase
MSEAKLAHPSLEHLTAFAQGQLSEEGLVQLSAHLSDCADCRQTVEGIADDTLVSLLRAANTERKRDELSSPLEAITLSPVGPAQASPGLPPELADHSRYRVQELLGVGGMGSVYKAEHLLMERPVALKLISPALTRDPAMVDRFRREVKAAGRLKHPNIVMAHDAEQAGDWHFLVMEHVEGKSLARIVAEQGPLPVRQACHYIHQAALGLQHAHERGMVHRDIKPHNLMRTPEDQIKILDFGLARFALETVPAGALVGDSAGAMPAASAGTANSGSLTQVGTVMGTPDYIAPEQITDARTADIRADIYSLGCTLYDLLAGQPPFAQGTAIAKVMAHRERTPPPLAELRKDLPPDLVRLVDRMMAKDPAKRYQTPGEVAAALAPFWAPTRPVAHPAYSRPRRLVVLAASAAALVLAGIIYVATDKGRLRIEGDVEDVQVVISKSGKEVEVIDLKSGSVVKRLASGQYAVKLQGNRTDVGLTKEAFTITRWGETVVTVTHQPASNPVVQDAPIDLDHLAEGQTILGYKLLKPVAVDFYGPVWQALGPGGVQATLRIARGLDAENIHLQLEALELFRSLHHTSLAPLHAFWLIDKGGWVIEPGSLGSAKQSRPRSLLIVSEWVSKSLADRLRECRKAGHAGIPPQELRGYMRQAAGALDWLNARRHPLGEMRQLVRVVHRDIKPSNIVLSDDGTAKLANTGLFMVLRSDRASIPQGSLAMTAAYAPPEFFQGAITHRSDQYSLALTYVMLRTGKLPFEEFALENLSRVKSQGKLDLLLLPSEPERAAIARATAVNPADRYGTCGEMVEALDRILERQ